MRFWVKINGKEQSVDPTLILSQARAMQGKNVCIEIHEKKSVRSNQQNRFYWAYLGIIAADTGNSPEDLHEYFKRKLLPPQYKVILGNEVKLPASTTRLNKAEFSHYIMSIEELTGILAPEKDELSL